MDYQRLQYEMKIRAWSALNKCEKTQKGKYQKSGY